MFKNARSVRGMGVRLSRRLVGAWTTLRAGPGDPSTPGGRAVERNRRALKAILSGLAARAVSMLTLLITTPIVFRYLGAARFGVWATITSVVTILGLVDLGVGSGLVNRLSSLAVDKNTAAISRSISTAFMLLCALGAILAVVFAFLYGRLEWSSLLGAGRVVPSEDVKVSVGVVVGCALVALPLTVAQKVQIARQEGFVANAWLMLAAALSLIGLVVAVSARSHLPVLVLAFAGAPLVALTIQSWTVLGRRSELRPRASAISRKDARTLAASGLPFFVLQVVSLISFQIDVLVIARIRGPGEVSSYIIPSRLFAIVATVISVAAVSLWPAYSEAIARHDVTWALRTLRRSLWFSLAVGIGGSVILVLFGRSLISMWIGAGAPAPLGMILALSAFTVAGGLAGSIGMFLTGANRMRLQTMLGVAAAATNLAFSIWLTRRIGAAGAVWGSVIALLLVVVLPLGAYVPKLARDMRSETWQANDRSP